MKKLLFVMQSLYNGGAEKSLVNLLNELPENKYEVDLLLFRQEGMFLSQVPKWVRILKTPDTLRLLYSPLQRAGKYKGVKLFGTIRSRIEERNIRSSVAYRWMHSYNRRIEKVTEKYDVAIAYISGEVLYFVGDKVDADKKIVWIHNDYKSASHPQKYDYKYLKEMDGIVSISDECVNILKEVFPEFTDKIYNIANITSAEVTRKRAMEFVPKEYEPNPVTLISIGRLNPQKGFDMAIDAAYMLKRKHIQFQWFILGNGPLEKSLKDKIKQKDVGDCFHLLGAKENPYPYIQNATIFVQTSRFEGKSVVLDEAKILGKPIVVTNYATVKDQIEDGKEGIIVPMNPEGIAAGIEKMLTDTSLRQNIHTYLSEHEYGNQNEVQKYIDLIDGV